ncbi:MAG TPA: hypothetical protein VFX03_04375 [Thermomicrobiales bacterium]|nr:hypothetical protein [Thermomicrobiales bacterium]
MRVALFAGLSGQDGWHLARPLLAERTMVWSVTRGAEAVPLVANPTKARRLPGLEPTRGFDTLVDPMVDAEVSANAAGAAR